MTDTDLIARLDALEAANADLAARNAVLADRIDHLECRTAPAAPAPVPVATEVEDTALDRRRLLKRGVALAGAAAAGAVLLDAAPAAAANGNPLLVGVSNAGSEQTSLTYTGTSGYGFNVSGASPISAVRAAGPSNGGGLSVFGGKYHMAFERSGGRVPPIQDTVFHNRGEVVIDAYSNLWYCIGDGTPGTWRTLAGNGSALPGAGSFYPTPGPIRVYDSRPGTTPAVGSKTPLAAGATRIVDLKVNGSGIYAGVNTAVLNVLLVNASAGNGNFTVWAANQPKPAANTLVWGGSTGRFSTLAYSLLDGAARVNVNASLATDLVVDVVGFYR